MPFRIGRDPEISSFSPYNLTSVFRSLPKRLVDFVSPLTASTAVLAEISARRSHLRPGVRYDAELIRGEI